jgi:2-aminoadipate transaminase
MHAAAHAKPLALPLSSKAARTKEAPISYLIATAFRNPNLINFAAGLVDPQMLPADACGKITEKIFADPVRCRAALQYDTTLGLSDLRREVLKHLEDLEGLSGQSMGLTADQIVITTGSQQALYIVADVLVDPGDIVIAAGPSYFVFTGALDSLGATILSVPMDDDGMDVDAVERVLRNVESQGKLDRVKFVYCTSYYQNPTGLTLSAERRPRLLDVVKRFSRNHRILVLEDAAYRELRYDGPAHRSIKSYDPDNLYTVLSHTLSKPFSPGLKMGYTAMPADLLHAVIQQKGSHDFGSSSLTQHIALEAFRDGSYARQVGLLKKGYRVKRDLVLSSLKKFMPKHPGIHWTHPHGGLYVWLTLPKFINTSRIGKMFARCIESGVLYVPGEYCFQADESGTVPENQLRLSFGQVAPEQIEPGIERLSKVVSELMNEHASSAAAGKVETSP